MKALLIVLLLISSAHARWATEQDLTYKTVDAISTTVVNADGTYETTDSITYEILNEAAKEKFGLYKLPYRSSSSSLKILEANVTNGDVVTKVSLANIVDRSIAKENGMDDTKEIQIPFPQLHVKSKIFIKYKRTVSKVVVPNHFSLNLGLGFDGMEVAGTYQWISAIPLNYKVQDPYNVLEVTETKDNKQHRLSFRLKSPYLHQVAQERGLLPADKITLIKISSDTSWDAISNNMTSRFETILSAPLPSELDQVVNEVKAQKSLSDKVDHAVAYLTQNYNYVGDWQTLEGGFSPRKIEQILKTKYGDCKDFSTVLTGILRKAGINAHIALVNRGLSALNRYYSTEMPSPGLFNHAIVRVNEKNQSFWIDPTNPTSFGLKHRDDIAGKNSLVLDGKSTLAHIPKISGDQNGISLTKSIVFSGTENAEVQGKLNLKGIFGLIFTGLEQKEPLDKIQKVLANFISQGEDITLPEYSSFDFKTKKYRDVNVSVKYTTSDLIGEYQDKKYLKLPDLGRFVQSFLISHHQWEGDSYLGEPFILQRKIVLKNLFVNERVEGCNIDTRWVHVKREIEYLKDGIALNDYVKYKEDVVLNSDFKTTEYEMLQHKLGSCIADSGIEILEGSKRHAPGFEEVEAGFAKFALEERIKKRLEYARGIVDEKKEGLKNYELWKLLRKNISEDPKSVDSYLVLALSVMINGYLNGSKYTPQSLREANEVIDKGLTVLPQNISLSLQKLRIADLSGDIEKVKNELPIVLTYGKVTSVTDVMNLSRLYKSLKLHDKSIRVLAEALKGKTNNVDKEKLHFQLATTNYSQRNYKESLYHYLQVLKLDPKDGYTYTNLPNVLVSMKKYDAAVKIALKGYKIHKSGMMEQVASDTLGYRASKYLKESKLDLAEADYRKSIQVRKSAYAYRGIAQIAYLKGNPDRAVAVISEGVSASEDDPANYYIQSAQMFHTDYDFYSKIMKKAFEASQDPNMKLWTGQQLGHAYLNLKKYDEVKAVMGETIAVGEGLIAQHPDEPSIILNLGASYTILGAATKDNPLIQKGLAHLRNGKAIQPENKNFDYFISSGLMYMEGPSPTRMPASDMKEKIKNLKPGQVMFLK